MYRPAIYVYVPTDLRDAAKKVARQRNTSLTQVVVRAMTVYLSENFGYVPEPEPEPEPILP